MRSLSIDRLMALNTRGALQVELGYSGMTVPMTNSHSLG